MIVVSLATVSITTVAQSWLVELRFHVEVYNISVKSRCWLLIWSLLPDLWLMWNSSPTITYMYQQQHLFQWSQMGRTWNQVHTYVQYLKINLTLLALSWAIQVSWSITTSVISLNLVYKNWANLTADPGQFFW